MIREAAGGVELTLRVIPRARRSEVTGTRGDALVVRLAAPPVDGAANLALIRFIAGCLGLPSRSIHIVSGARARDKRVVITGTTADEVRRLLHIS